LHVRVPVHQSEGDLAQLGETFNRMTQELRSQRDDIMRARDLIDSRRRFTEAVLAGASAGVIGVDGSGCVSILNRSAEKLIGRTEAEALGRPLTEVFPELADFMAAAQSNARTQDQVTITRNGRERNLSVRITSEQSAETDHGYVVTLDDITELVAAQRTSAWADIARRIAHEIKNPLTPIQLSAERLRRQLSTLTDGDARILDECTRTIIGEVGDLKRLVNEFAAFARMPQLNPVPGDLNALAEETVGNFREANPAVEFELVPAARLPTIALDREALKRALVNLLDNAVAAALSGNHDGARARIVVRTGMDPRTGVVTLEVCDNGPGIEPRDRARIFEPYFSTKKGGTGLGLAIVATIVTDHHGFVRVYDNRPHGSRFVLEFPVKDPEFTNASA
jgi:two-component system nitrogen regulation sensor histidine kinase NtrY